MFLFTLILYLQRSFISLYIRYHTVAVWYTATAIIWVYKGCCNPKTKVTTTVQDIMKVWWIWEGKKYGGVHKWHHFWHVQKRSQHCGEKSIFAKASLHEQFQIFTFKNIVTSKDKLVNIEAGSICVWNKRRKIICILSSWFYIALRLQNRYRNRYKLFQLQLEEMQLLFEQWSVSPAIDLYWLQI